MRLWTAFTVLLALAASASLVAAGEAQADSALSSSSPASVPASVPASARILPAQISPAQILLAQILKDKPLPLPGDNSTAQSKEDPNTAVRFLFPEQVTLPARQSTLVDLHFHIAPGLHINSHLPHEKTLIPTRLAVDEGDGVQVTAVEFPPGTDYSLAFSPREKLSVYTGDFVLHARMTAQPGEHLLQAALHYQACDVNSCMPPHTIPVAISVIAK